MILLSIDPGYQESHYVILDACGSRVIESWSGGNDQLLGDLRCNTNTRSFLYDQVLIESMDPFGLRLGRETMDTILWIGRFMEAGRAELVPRSLIKMTMCGTRRADDASIRRVLIDRLGAPGTAKNPGPTYGVSGHRWQALAVAVTWLEVNKEILQTGGDCPRSRAPQMCPSTLSNEAVEGGEAQRINSTPIGNEAPAGADSPGPPVEPLPLFAEESE